MERLQRFSIRKLSIGAVSCVIGTVAFFSYSNEVKAAENTDTSLKIVETNSANNPATSNVTVDNTNKQAVANNSDQSKPEDSSAVAPTSEKTQLQTSQDSSIKVKENNLNNDRSDTTKAVAKPTNLNDENNSRDPDSKDIEVKPKESSNVDTNEQREKKVTWHDTFHWVYADKDDLNNKALHKAEDDLAGKKFADDTVVTITFTPKDGKYSTDGIEVSQTGPKLNFTGITDLGTTTSTTDNKTNHKFRLSFDYNSIPVPQGYDLAHSAYIQTFTLEEGDGQLSYQTPDNEQTVAAYKRNSQTFSITYVDDDENGKNIWDPITSKVKEGQIVNVNTNIQDNLKKLENYILVPNQNLPETITVGNKAIDPIVVHLKHKTEQREATKTFGQFATFSLSGPYGASLSAAPNMDMYVTSQDLFIKGTQKYDLVTRDFIGEATWDYSHIYQTEGDSEKSTEVKDLDVINSLGDLDKTYIQEGGIYVGDSGSGMETHKELDKLISEAHNIGPISTQTWLKDGLHADGYYLSEKASLVFDGKSWLNLKEYQEKVDPNFTWTTTNDSVVMLGDHAVDHINPEKITSDLLPKLDSELTGMSGGRAIYLNYVPYTYKHHSAQRTINIHLPNGEVKTVSQKADAKQPVFTVNAWPDYFYNGKSASQEIGNWINGEWVEYDAPVVAGYTASQPTVSAKTVTGDTQNETIDITYVASEHTSHVKLVDNDNKTIQDTPVTGKTGETANVSVTVPKGWQLTSGQELPTQISFNAEGHPDVVVQIEHKTIRVTPDNPKENGTVLPDNPSVHFNGVSHDDLNKTVTRTVNITAPDGKKTTTTQTVTFTRGATVDEVTGEVTYDLWSENGTHTFDKVDMPTVPGYTPSGEVPSIVVTPDTKSSTVNITYTTNNQNITVRFIDKDDDDKLVGDPIVITGKTGETINLPKLPENYRLADGENDKISVTGKPSQSVTIRLKHQTEEKTVNKDLTYPIYGQILLPEWASDTYKGFISSSKNASPETFMIASKNFNISFLQKVDKVTGKVIEERALNATDLELGKINIPLDIGSWEVFNTVVDHTQGRSPYDYDFGTDRDLQDHASIKPPVDQNITVKELLAKYGYDSVYATVEDFPGITGILHGIIDPDSPQLKQIPAITGFDNPILNNPILGKHTKDKWDEPAIIVLYVPYKHEKKTVIRQITIVNPNGSKDSVLQNTQITRVTFDKGLEDRMGTINADWSTSSLPEYIVPQIPGYKASLDKVDLLPVDKDSQDTKVVITYTALDGTQTIIYRDTEDHDITKQQIPGKTDQKVKVTPEVPDGYVVKDKVPSEVTIKATDDPIIVTVQHGTTHVDHDHPVDKGDLIPGTEDKHYPAGLTYDDLNKTVTRTVNITDPSGKKTTSVQTVTFTRGATVDEVTGEVTYDDWSENGTHTFDKIDVPTVQGYTASGDVPSIVVTPETQLSKVDITYIANAQHMAITYVDDTTGETLKQDKLDGTSDQDTKYATGDNIKRYTDLHYKLVSDSTNGQDLIFDHDDNVNQTYEVHFVHNTQKVNRQDTVTSTIDYKFEDGKTAQPTVTQTKQFSEDGVKDLVTGKIAWDKAKPQKFDDIATKSIVGYTPDKNNVAGSTVKFGDQDVEVTVTYHNNVQTATITCIDDTENKTLGSEQQNGKFDHEIVFEHDPAEVIKGWEEKGYKLVSNDFKQGIKYQADNKSNSFEVHLVHTYEPVETSQTITETVHYIDANGKPVAPDHVATVVIKVTGTRDKVTDSITWNTPSTGHFDEVISPEVPNMTPDKKFIPSRNVQYGDSDITENVVYTSDETSREPEKPNDQGKPNSKTPEKPNKSGNPTSKTSEKSNKSSKEVSKQFGTIAKTTIPEKPIDSRTVDNHVSAKTTTKRELPQTGTTANTGIWTGLVSIITSLGLFGASKKRKKN